MHRSSVLLVFSSLMLIGSWSIAHAIVYQIPPSNVPSGLPAQIQGKYRIIEHDRPQKMWYVYDVQKWKKYIEKEFSEEAIKMYPPIHQYAFTTNGWVHEIVNEPMNTAFRTELVTIIERGKPPKQAPAEGNQLSAKEAEAIVVKAFYPKHLWSFKSIEHKNGILVCAFTQGLPNSVGLWWAKGNKVYNVNGVARSITKNFELTFDKNINVPKAFEKCKSLQ